MRNVRSPARDDARSEAGHGSRAFAAFEADDGAQTAGNEGPSWLPPIAPRGLPLASLSHAPGRSGLALAGVWIALVIGCPIGYWGLGPIAAQPPAFFVALAALAFIPAFAITMASTAVREVMAARVLVAEIAAATASSPLIDQAAERDAWRRTLAHAEESALSIVDLIAREREAATETVDALKTSLEAAIQTAARQIRAAREASRLVGEDSRAMEATFAQTVAAMHRLSERLRGDLQAAEALGAKAGDVVGRIEAEGQAASERIAEAAKAADEARVRLDHSIAQANEVTREVETRTSQALAASAPAEPVRAVRAARPRPSQRALEAAQPLPYGDIAEDLGLDWLVATRPVAIDMLASMDIAPSAEINERDLAAIARRARLGASARRRAVCDCAPGAVARITYVLERDAQVKRALAAFHRDPGFDAAAPVETWDAETDLVRAYLLLDAALA